MQNRTIHYYILTFQILAVKWCHSIQKSWSRYQDTGVMPYSHPSGRPTVRSFSRRQNRLPG